MFGSDITKKVKGYLPSVPKNRGMLFVCCTARLGFRVEG